MNVGKIKIALQAGLNAMTFKESEFTVSKKEIENCAISLILDAMKEFEGHDVTVTQQVMDFDS